MMEPSPPAWLATLAEAAGAAHPQARFAPPADGSARDSAVLMLFGQTDGQPDVLLTERAHTLRSHAGQVSFPGGAIDDIDDGPVAAALREGAEETGLDPAGVDVLTTMRPLWISVSNYVVTPVIAWWRVPTPVRPVDLGEVSAVIRVPVAELLDPGQRLRVGHPSGMVGPAFRLGNTLVWGFTAGLLSRVFELAGMEQPWDQSLVEPLPPGDPRGADTP